MLAADDAFGIEADLARGVDLLDQGAVNARRIRVERVRSVEHRVGDDHRVAGAHEGVRAEGAEHVDAAEEDALPGLFAERDGNRRLTGDGVGPLPVAAGLVHHHQLADVPHRAAENLAVAVHLEAGAARCAELRKSQTGVGVANVLAQVWVAYEERDKPALRGLVADFCVRLGQETMYLEFTESTVELIPPREEG